MFQFFKKVKKNNNLNNSLKKNVDVIRFKDSILQDISLTISPDGNNTLLCISEPVNNYKIIIDKEKALLLSIVLGEYYKKENFSDLSNLFNNESEGK